MLLVELNRAALHVQPLENLVPVLTNPKLNPNRPAAVELLGKVSKENHSSTAFMFSCRNLLQGECVEKLAVGANAMLPWLNLLSCRRIPQM